MTTVKLEVCCVQCSLKAMVEAIEAGDPIPEPVAFPGTVQEHMTQHHGDPVATQRERDDLEARLQRFIESGRAARWN